MATLQEEGNAPGAAAGSQPSAAGAGDGICRSYCVYTMTIYIYIVMYYTCTKIVSFFRTAVICNGHHGNPIGSSSRVYPHIGCSSSESSDSSSESRPAGWLACAVRCLSSQQALSPPLKTTAPQRKPYCGTLESLWTWPPSLWWTATPLWSW